MAHTMHGGSRWRENCLCITFTQWACSYWHVNCFISNMYHREVRLVLANPNMEFGGLSTWSLTMWKTESHVLNMVQLNFFTTLNVMWLFYMQFNWKQSITLGNSNWSNLLGIHCWIFLSIIVALFNMFTSRLPSMGTLSAPQKAIMHSLTTNFGWQLDLVGLLMIPYFQETHMCPTIGPHVVSMYIILALCVKTHEAYTPIIKVYPLHWPMATIKMVHPCKFWSTMWMTAND